MVTVTIDLKKFIYMFDKTTPSPWTKIRNWCQENCYGEWSYLYETVWEFELESDAVAFKLRWT